MKFDEKYKSIGVTEYVVMMGNNYRVTDDPASEQRQHIKATIFNDDEPMLNIGGDVGHQSEYVIKGYLKLSAGQIRI